MGTCRRVRFDKRKICAGDLRHEISIIDRQIEPDVAGYAMDFTNGIQTRAAIKTRTDVLNFDGTNTGTAVTHDFYIRKGKTVQRNFTILFDSRYFMVVGIEQLDEDRMFMRITTQEAGTTSNQSNY